MTISRRKFILSGAAVTLGSVALDGALLNQAIAQARGDRLTVILNPEPPTLMLGLNQQAPTQIVSGKIYQGLLAYDFDLTPRPGLAKEWTVSDDGLTYVFKLYDNVTWHDGKPFTAHDVIFSTQTFLQEVHSRARSNFASVASATALDDHTVEYKLSKPFSPFLQVFEVSSAPIIPRHIYEGTDYRNNPMNQTPIGTGPFKFAEWKRGEYVHLVRNENYFRPDMPKLDNLYFQVIPDSSTRLVALQGGAVDVSSFGDIDYVFLPQLRADPTFEVTEKGYEFAGPVAAIEFNNRAGSLADKRFRQAILHAVDRDFVMQNIWFGQAQLATGPFNSATRYYSDTGPLYPFDPARSEALLDEMGLAPGAGGTRATVKLLGLPYGDSWTKLGEYVKQSLQKVGIEVQIETTDAGGWVQRYVNWDFEMTFGFWYQYGDPALGISRLYITSNIRQGVYGSNVSGYSNPVLDKLFEDAAVEVDLDKRTELYQQAQQVLVDDLPMGWMFEIRFPTVMRAGYSGVITSAIGVSETFEAAQLG